jgi:hypothetical protein
VPVILKSGNLNLLEPSGPVQTCSGTDLPLLLEDIFFHTLGSAGEIKTQWEGHYLLTDFKKAFDILLENDLILHIQLRISVN